MERALQWIDMSVTDCLKPLHLNWEVSVEGTIKQSHTA